MKTMDRYLFANFIVSWGICFVSLVGLYVVIDLFANVDEFIEDHEGTLVFVRRTSKYYAIHSLEYFNRLAPIITMIAAMITLASLHRHNELVALLAAGIPTVRALLPVLTGAGVMVALGVANREYLLPRFSEQLQRRHEDIEANRVLENVMRIDKDQILFKALEAHRENQRLVSVNVTLPTDIVGQIQEVQAPVAYYRRDDESGKMGWHLVKPNPVQIVRKTDKVKRVGPDDQDLFIFSDVSFADMIRIRNWMNFASTDALIAELQDNPSTNPQSIGSLVHARLMQPVLNMLLVLMGVPFVLQWGTRHLYWSVAVCMVLSGLFFVVDAMAAYFAAYGYLDPMTAAWTPVFLFGPVAFAMFHRIGT